MNFDKRLRKLFPKHELRIDEEGSMFAGTRKLHVNWTALDQVPSLAAIHGNDVGQFLFDALVSEIEIELLLKEQPQNFSTILGRKPSEKTVKYLEDWLRKGKS